MAIYVLVRGGWTGAQGFRTVRRLLQADGHDVFTPSLTGVGERVHLASPLVGLSTHVQDVVNCLEFEDLREVVLLGFSYGGAVVTGVVEHAAGRSGNWSISTRSSRPMGRASRAWPALARRSRRPTTTGSSRPRCASSTTRPRERGRTPAGFRIPGSGPFTKAADHARASPRWRYREIDTTHMVASNRPGELVSILRELA